MTPSIPSFLDELEKIGAEKEGATLDELRAAYRRIAPLRTKAKGINPTKMTQMLAGGQTALGLRDAASLTGPSTIPRLAQLPALDAAVKRRAEKGVTAMTQMGLPPEYIESFRADLPKMIAAQTDQAKQFARAAGGAILMPAGGMSGFMGRKGNLLGMLHKPEGPAQQRAANILTGVHEGFERQVRNTPERYVSHLSPEVIHKEHNMLAGLSGPGAEEGRQFFQGLRSNAEGPDMAARLQNRYGEKAAPWLTYGQGPKMPKAMRKDLLRNWESTAPAAPDFGKFGALKTALTRSVKEWRAANAAGDASGAGQIAQGAAALGNKPRYLEDISMGGEEAGVDKMMGHAGAPAPAAPSFQQRLETYKGNKAQLGVAGRSPTPSVMQSQEGRAALLRGTQAAPQAPAPNESGLLARKLYKPDSTISRGEFTPQLLAQKQQVTDLARALSPEAKAMVPAMYGYETHGSGGLQRSTSTHEFVPGISDLRGKNVGTDGQHVWSRGPQAHADLANIQQTVLNPMAAKGHTMADTVSAAGTNYGNVVNSPQGPKVLDFLPQSKGQLNPAIQSFGKYAPTKTEFAPGEAHGTMGALRKEVFNPKMNIQEASPEMQSRAQQVLMGKAPSISQVPAPSTASEMATIRPGAGARSMTATSSSASNLSHMPTALTTPVGHAAVGGIWHAPTAIATHIPSSAVPVLGQAERAAVTRAPGLLRAAGGALSHL